MACRRGKSAWRNLRRRLCSGLTLIAYLAAALGFPVPEGLANEHGSAACGPKMCCCGSVEQCKTSGCGCSHPAPAADPIPDEQTLPSCCTKHPPSSGHVKKSPLFPV